MSSFHGIWQLIASDRYYGLYLLGGESSVYYESNVTLHIHKILDILLTLRANASQDCDDRTFVKLV